MPEAGPSICICACTLVVLSLVVLFFSFASLEYTELGLDFSMITYDVNRDGGVFTSGLYFLGLGHYFLRFPGKIQSIQFSDEDDADASPLRSRTLDGLEVVLEISFQYRLTKDGLMDVYEKFGNKYQDIYVVLAIHEITEQATHFNADTFFRNRTLITDVMSDSIQTLFRREAFCDVPSFQLRSVSLPTPFEQAIQFTEVQKQDIDTAEAERLNREVAAVTQVLVAEKEAEQTLIKADAQAITTQLNVDAYVVPYNLSQELQAQAFLPIFDRLDRNESSFLDYLNVRAMRDHPSQNSVVNIGLLLE